MNVVNRKRCVSGRTGGVIADPMSSDTAAMTPASPVHQVTGFTCKYRYRNEAPSSAVSHQYATARAPMGHIQNGLAFSSALQKSIAGRALSYQRA